MLWYVRSLTRLETQVLWIFLTRKCLCPLSIEFDTRAVVTSHSHVTCLLKKISFFRICQDKAWLGKRIISIIAECCFAVCLSSSPTTTRQSPCPRRKSKGPFLIPQWSLYVPHCTTHIYSHPKIQFSQHFSTSRYNKTVKKSTICIAY